MTSTSLSPDLLRQVQHGHARWAQGRVHANLVLDYGLLSVDDDTGCRRQVPMHALTGAVPWELASGTPMALVVSNETSPRVLWAAPASSA